MAEAVASRAPATWSVGSLARWVDGHEAVHRAVPWPVARAALTRLAERAWERDAMVREHARLQMRYLLERSAWAGDVDASAREYVVEGYLRVAKWYRPALTTKPAPRNVELLGDLRRTGRGTVVSLVHQGDYYSALSAIARAGQPLHIAAAPFFLRDTAGPRERQVVRLLTRYGARIFPANGNSDHIRGLLREGNTVVLASDVPGRTTVPVLGRRVRLASGAARLAMDTGAWVAPMIAEGPGGERRHVFGQPLDAGDFTTPEALLTALLARYEPAILAWPAGFHSPLRRWAPADEADVAAYGWTPDMPLRV